jgi:transposase
MEVLMGAAIRLREDFTGEQLRRLARKCRDGAQTRRLLALSTAYDGAARSGAAKIGGVTPQIIRDWVVRFNADGPDGLLNRWSSGPKRKLIDEHRRALAEMVDRGPDLAIHGVVRWRRCDLAKWLREEFDISVEESTA